MLVVEGATQSEHGDDDATAHDALLTLLLEEIPVSGAARVAASITGASRHALYARALELKKD